MWKSWFEQYAHMVDVLQLRDSLEARMQEHFDAMLTFAQEPKAATAWADRLMGEGGMFASLAAYKTASGASFFFTIAQAKPKAALRRFAAALGAETIEVRHELVGNARRTAVHWLEQLAVPSETFFEAAECLLLLAEAENESWSNNSTGVFSRYSAWDMALSPRLSCRPSTKLTTCADYCAARSPSEGNCRSGFGQEL
ncbi:MAG: Signal transduction histidine kinase CheA (EC [uncultured Caballeronia sp.]|nr:MAG: Signal transduction histidine kinase CheA (EC [uncultured Caballeronia sp.]